MTNWNPFARRETHSVGVVRTHKLVTTLSWILSVVVSIYYTYHAPHDGFSINRTIWGQNYAHPSAFTMNHVIAEIYWTILFIFQFGYVLHLFSEDTATVYAAANVGSHFVLNNLLHFAFVMLFVRSHFRWAEVMLLLNFVNLTSLYFNHDTRPPFIQGPVASAPLAWTFVAIYWNGALMLAHPAHEVPRILGNVVIWSILAFGMFFVVAFDDRVMGFALTLLTAAIGTAQFERKAVALQWIFAFVIMAVLFVFSLGVEGWRWSGREVRWRRVRDEERAPLLSDG